MAKKILENTEGNYWPLENPLQKQYIDYLGLAEDVFLLDQKHLKQDISMGTVMVEAVRLLTVYEMDPEFLQDPENALFTLAVTQDLHHITQPSEREKLLLAFTLGAHNYESKENFNYSAKIRELYNPDYTPKLRSDSVMQLLPEEKAIRRTNVPQHIAAASPDKMSMNISNNDDAIDFYDLLLNLCDKFGIDSHILTQIDLHFVDQDIILRKLGMLAYTEHFPDGKRVITIARNAPNWIKEHEGIHAIFEVAQKGYEGVLWMGAVEAGTENLVSNPRIYEIGRSVLDTLFTKVSDKKFSEDFISSLKGDRRARVDFLTSLIKHYGLVGYLPFALFNPGATEAIVHRIGKINRIFLDPEEVKEFFSHPKAA